MRFANRLLLSLTVVAAGAACASEPQEPPQAGAGTSTAAQAPAGTTGAATPDTGFIQGQLMLGEKEIGLARLALEKSTRPGVRQFAEKLLRDHQQAGDELRQIAVRQQVNVTTNADQLDVERDRLSKLSGAAFDREYLVEMIADHERAVRDLEAVSKDENAEIRGWATKTLPHVREHLETARKLQSSQ
jgi:putative membrane protein